MVYHVIGLMSGSSLDGLDIAFVQLEEVRGKWDYQLIHAECVGYPEKWSERLRTAINGDVAAFLELNTAYGRYTGEQVNAFIEKFELQHRVHFIASHGHTIHHNPAKNTSFQLGEGATIAAVTGMPVISDLRNVDVALGGQGAPIVPIGDQLLFGIADYWLNIGGIANISIRTTEGIVAFDVCAANQILNTLAAREGKTMDEGGAIARSGQILGDVLDELQRAAYYHQPAPKSLSNEAALQLVFPALLESSHATADLLCTATELIAAEVAAAVRKYGAPTEAPKMLITGGGAFNNYLINRIEHALKPLNIAIEIPRPDVIKFKEAIVMALIGTLRWREERNVLSAVTGAARDSCGGALWLG